MKSAETVALEKRVDKLETIVKCMGNATEIANLLNRLDAMESLEKRRDELYTKLMSVYDRICGALTFYESEDETDDPDCDKGLALYGDIVDIHRTMAEWGL